MKKLLLLITVIITGLLLASCSMDQDLPGKVYFVSVALDYTNNGAPNLDGTKSDQKIIVEAVKNLAGSDDVITVFSSFKECSEYDSVNYVTRYRFDSYINTIKDTVEEDDIFIFHYSGHGDEDGSLVFDGATDRSSYALYYPSDFIATLSKLDCHKLLILDSCYSGQFLTKDNIGSVQCLSDGGNYVLGSDETDDLIYSSFYTSVKNAIEDFGKVGDVSKLWVLSACSDNQKAVDSFTLNGIDVQNGVLTYFCTQYLKDEDRKVFTAQGIFDEVISALNSASTSHTPQTSLKAMDLVLFRRSK